MGNLLFENVKCSKFDNSLHKLSWGLDKIDLVYFYTNVRGFGLRLWMLQHQNQTLVFTKCENLCALNNLLIEILEKFTVECWRNVELHAFSFWMSEKRLHHILNHHSHLRYLSWSLVIYRLEVIVMCLLWVLIGSSGYLSWFWLTILIHLVLVYDTQFRIVHSKSNFLSFIKPVGRFDEYP